MPEYKVHHVPMVLADRDVLVDAAEELEASHDPFYDVIAKHLRMIAEAFEAAPTTTAVDDG